MEEFLIENTELVLNSWLFNNINFEKINLVKFLECNSIDQSLKNFILQDTVNKFSVICINNNKENQNLDFDLNLLCNNYKILQELLMKNINVKDLSLIIEKLKHNGIIFENVKKLTIESSLLVDVEHSDFKTKINNLFPNIDTIFLNNNYMNSLSYIMYSECNTIKKVSLINSHLTTSLFNDVFVFFTRNLKNLVELDLSDNRLTSIKFDKNTKGIEILNNLKILILRNNNINQFKISCLNYFPNLKILDLTNNNFNSNNDFLNLKKYIKFVLYSKNPFLLSSKENTLSYIDYLNKTLKTSITFFENLELSYVYNNKTSYLFEILELNNSIKVSLKALNLCNNYLSTTNIERFFSVNQGFENLIELKMKDNNIDDLFIQYLAKRMLKEKFENLKDIDLSNNLITFNSAYDICDIFNLYHKLSNLTLNNNKIEEYINVFISQQKVNDVMYIFNENDITSFYHFFEKLIKINQIKKHRITLTFNKRIQEGIEQLIKEPEIEGIIIFSN